MPCHDLLCKSAFIALSSRPFVLSLSFKNISSLWLGAFVRVFVVLSAHLVLLQQLYWYVWVCIVWRFSYQNKEDTLPERPGITTAHNPIFAEYEFESAHAVSGLRTLQRVLNNLYDSLQDMRVDVTRLFVFFNFVPGCQAHQG